LALGPPSATGNARAPWYSFFSPWHSGNARAPWHSFYTDNALSTLATEEAPLAAIAQTDLDCTACADKLPSVEDAEESLFSFNWAENRSYVNTGTAPGEAGAAPGEAGVTPPNLPKPDPVRATLPTPLTGELMRKAVLAIADGTMLGMTVGNLAWLQGEDLVRAHKRRAALGPSCATGNARAPWHSFYTNNGRSTRAADQRGDVVDTGGAGDAARFGDGQTVPPSRVGSRQLHSQIHNDGYEPQDLPEDGCVFLYTHSHLSDTHPNTYMEITYISLQDIGVLLKKIRKDDSPSRIGQAR
jgi:hypothetical protein